MMRQCEVADVGFVESAALNFVNILNIHRIISNMVVEI